MHQIVTQGDRVNYLERKSRLDAITQLLSQQLTQNELRNVASMLFLAADNHDGIRHYLSGFSSNCIPKLVDVMGGFSEYIQGNDVPKMQQDRSAREDMAEGISDEKEPAKHPASYFLRVTAAKAVCISFFTDDIYEQVSKSTTI